jgi:fatty-acyl-CoA synthase
MAQTLIDVLQATSHITHKGYDFLDGRLESRPWSFADLNAEADRRAAYFQSLGLNEGDRIAMIVPDGQDFVLTFFGAIRAGLVPVPMYPPLALGKMDSYVESARKIMTTAGARYLVTSKAVAPVVWSLVPRVPTLEDLLTVEKVEKGAKDTEHRFVDPGLRPEDTCFLQFTSGSTSDPKGVVVTHANLVANAKAIMVDGLKSDGEKDRGVSWLPLYHDMGLIGFVVAPMLTEVPVVFIPTLSFVKGPNTWMETIHEHRGTITFAPNFAFGLAAKRMSAKRAEKLDLSCLRVVGCGAEPIHADTMRNFVEAFAPAGLKAEAVMPAYGMAEATLAITFDRLDRPFRTARIDRTRYELDKVVEPSNAPDAMELVSCGHHFPGHEVGIMGDDKELVGEGRVGEVVLRGPSVTGGYFENDEATATLLRDGWLHSGDLGFILNGELYISGRMKDLIILNGRNYYPQSIEWEVEQVSGVRRGNVVAFAVTGAQSEELVVVAESRAPERETLSKAIKQRVHDAFGLRARDVVLVEPGALPKTSSGKLQRRRTRNMYETSTLESENRAPGATSTKLKLARHLTASAVARITHSVKQPARRLAGRITSNR